MEGKIPRIVLTGGPCAGKSTALSILRQKLPEFGYSVFIVPEVATLISEKGIKIGEIMVRSDLVSQFERHVLQTQLALEGIWEKFALTQPGDKKVLICDRGAMDIASYIDWSVFLALAGDLGFSIFDLRDRRYDAVFHLATAAEGAEEHYNLDNVARYENPQQARERDKKTLAAWDGHTYRRVIANVEGDRQISFAEKMNKLLAEVCQSLKIPVPLVEIEKKYLVDLGTDPAQLPVVPIVFEIKQTYLMSSQPEWERRVRERREVASGEMLYTYTEKKAVRPGVREQPERVITEKEYRDLLEQRDPNRMQIVKKRYAFWWSGQLFELDFISSPTQLVVLEAELTDEQSQLVLPPFIKRIKEVTDDERYTNARIAAGTCPGYG